MTTTGYGVYHAHSTNEMWVASVIMLIGKILFGLILANFASTLANQEAEQVTYEQMLDGVKVSHRVKVITEYI